MDATERVGIKNYTYIIITLVWIMWKVCLSFSESDTFSNVGGAARIPKVCNVLFEMLKNIIF